MIKYKYNDFMDKAQKKIIKKSLTKMLVIVLGVVFYIILLYDHKNINFYTLEGTAQIIYLIVMPIYILGFWLNKIEGRLNINFQENLYNDVQSMTRRIFEGFLLAIIFIGIILKIFSWF